MHGRNLGLIAAAALLAAGCSGSKPNLTISARTGASLRARGAAAAAPATSAVTPGEVKLVIRRLELKGIDASGKEIEVKAGPIPVDLVGADLSGTTHSVSGGSITPGTYTQLEMEIGDIEVLGTDSTGTAFDFKTSIVVEQETCGNFQVDASGNLNFTLNVDVSSWFVDRDTSQPLDPTEANRHAIEENIERSFEVFEDNNEDGQDDDCECESGDSGSSASSSSASSHSSGSGSGCSCSSTCVAPMCQQVGGPCTSNGDCCGGSSTPPTVACAPAVPPATGSTCQPL